MCAGLPVAHVPTPLRPWQVVLNSRANVSNYERVHRSFRRETGPAAVKWSDVLSSEMGEQRDKGSFIQCAMGAACGVRNSHRLQLLGCATQSVPKLPEDIIAVFL